MLAKFCKTLSDSIKLPGIVHPNGTETPASMIQPWLLHSQLLANWSTHLTFQGSCLLTPPNSRGSHLLDDMSKLSRFLLAERAAVHFDHL